MLKYYYFTIVIIFGVLISLLVPSCIFFGGNISYEAEPAPVMYQSLKTLFNSDNAGVDMVVSVPNKIQENPELFNYLIIHILTDDDIDFRGAVCTALTARRNNIILPNSFVINLLNDRHPYFRLLAIKYIRENSLRKHYYDALSNIANSDNDEYVKGFAKRVIDSPYDNPENRSRSE